MTPTSVLLSVATSAKRDVIKPRVYLKPFPTTLPARPAGEDLADLLPDGWVKTHGEPYRRAS